MNHNTQNVFVSNTNNFTIYFNYRVKVNFQMGPRHILFSLSQVREDLVLKTDTKRHRYITKPMSMYVFYPENFCIAPDGAGDSFSPTVTRKQSVSGCTFIFSFSFAFGNRMSPEIIPVTLL